MYQSCHYKNDPMVVETTEAGTLMYFEPTTGLEMKALRFPVDPASKSLQLEDR